MRWKRLVAENSGVSLMEVMLAVAIFSGVIGVTAQSLASFYVTVDIQEQRMEAVSACRGVMDALREKRIEFKDNFPAGLMTWIDENNETEWHEFQANNWEHIELDDQRIQVEYFDQAGEVASPTDNPLVIHVTTTWKDRKGRDLSATVASMLTDQ